jgi:hypothetical protein
LQAYKEKKPRQVKQKKVTGGESLSLKVEAVDTSDSVDFLSQLPEDGLTRVSIKQSVEWSRIARE